MRFRFSVTAVRSRAAILKGQSEVFPRTYSHPTSPPPPRPSFGIAFDIDGVIIGGRAPIGGSPQAIQRLYARDGTLRIPFLFLTNGGGIPESKRASELSKLLGVNISPQQVVQGHTPFRELLNRFEDDPIVAVGKGDPATVMSEYGFKKVRSIDEYATYFPDIDPLAPFKPWVMNETCNKKHASKIVHPSYDVYSDRVKGVFVISDPVDWSRDIQVLCDILRTGGLPGAEKGDQPALYFASDDLEYQAAFPAERLGMGAFRIALESIYNTVNDSPLKYTSYGKPNPFVFKNAEAVLTKIVSTMHQHKEMTNGGLANSFSTLYMVGDNPKVDINGARKAGRPWFSVLTRTGVFKGKNNHAQFPADLVVDTVEEAVDCILRKEGCE
ncbi:cat eye syndrome critical region protein 5 [Carex littledalei]|uniref:Cat eye syndrome critical region protein 5 n=1 Tax=Carex littledalei TaxID=544730 RepID=A0A833R495_9POAL|nr:cat eye syndrome critical region protein 5 [Carex littledalei]